MEKKKSKKQIGRPRKAPVEGERVQLSFRVTPEMKRRLDAAAEQSGRSQSQEAEFRLERSFHHQKLLEEALSLKYGRGGAGIFLALAFIMQSTGKTYLINEAWRDIPNGAGIEDVDPARWHRALSMHWADDPDSREIGLLSLLLIFAITPPLKVKRENLVRYIKTAIPILKYLGMQDLPPASGTFRDEITSIRSLLSPDILGRSDATPVIARIIQALQRLSDLLPPTIAQLKQEDL